MVALRSNTQFCIHPLIIVSWLMGVITTNTQLQTISFNNRTVLLYGSHRKLSKYDSFTNLLASYSRFQNISKCTCIYLYMSLYKIYMYTLKQNMYPIHSLNKVQFCILSIIYLYIRKIQRF